MRSFLIASIVSCCLFSAPFFASNKRVHNYDGTFIDIDGRQRIFHGVNIVNKRPPYYPQAIGLNTKTAQFIAKQGFNLVRLGIFWTAIEKIPGFYDDNYLEQIAKTVQMLAKENIYTLLDFHQDAYSTKHGGLGAPDWAALAEGTFENIGFPVNLFGGLTINKAKVAMQLDEDYDAFWNNAPAKDGIGIQDRYLKMLKHVVTYFKGNENILGYELMNEPFVGTNWHQCTVSLETLDFSVGCAEFESGKLQNFYQNCLNVIRAIDQETIVFFEPHVFFNFGAPTVLFHLKDLSKQTGFSFHNYNTKSGNNALTLVKSLDSPFQQAEIQKTVNRFVPLMTEFGAASTTPEALEQILNLADAYQTSWIYWSFVNNPAYKFYQMGLFPTNPRKQGLVYNMYETLNSSNLDMPNLIQLSRVYPQAIAGHHASFYFNSNLNIFNLQYETYKNSSQLNETRIFIPLKRYPMGYQVKVQGGFVKSFPGSEILVIASLFGQEKISVTIQPQALISDKPFNHSRDPDL